MTTSNVRALRREATIATILDRAVTVMAEHGVAGLTMTRLAEAMGIKPPSLYKWFPSVLAVYDAVFARGQEANLEAFRVGVAGNEPGVAALFAGLTATAQWAVAHPVEAQLLFWRPVPDFRPSAQAMAPAHELVSELREVVRTAVGRGQLGVGAESNDGLVVLASLHFGVISQHLANEPDSTWKSGRYSRAHRRVVELFGSAYPAG
jgi:AcrR family transcriptional regulator